jgi:hypothetical protein
MQAFRSIDLGMHLGKRMIGELSWNKAFAWATLNQMLVKYNRPT